MMKANGYAVEQALQQFQQWFGNCDDVKMLVFGENGSDQKKSVIAYCEGMIDEEGLRDLFPIMVEQPLGMAERHDWPLEETVAAEWIFAGYVLCFYDTETSLYVLPLSKLPVRKPDESNSEASILGPKDGFVEDIGVNAALIRKRIRSNSLHYEQFVIGERSRTKTGMFYISDVAQEDIVQLARQRLQSIQVDSLFSGAHLEEYLSDHPRSLFPLLDYSGRSDFVVESLIKGRIAIVLDGCPTILIAPANFTVLLKSAEDSHTSPSFVIAERLIRMVALLCSIFLLGLWLALVNFHQTQLPFSLLATLVVSRHGVPITISFEAFMIVALFEVLREAGARLPKAVGQTLAVVGGLIIGDAAIRAGLSSPSLVVIAAISTISTFMLVNQSLSSNVTLLRIFVMICSVSLGLYGFMFAATIILLYMSDLRSFGMPYLYPLSPMSFKTVLKTALHIPMHSNEASIKKSKGKREA